jgi:hypothetical protein
MIEAGQSDWLVADLSPDERKFELPELTDETPIVRYVRLSTLFLYLSNRAFIPSLECLRSLDRFECMGDVGSVFNPKLKATLDSLFEQHRDFLRGNPVFAPTHPRPVIPPEVLNFGVRLKRWTDELAKRRAVWCWNLFEGESNAMWQLYGSKGVAIKSTIGLLKKALANSGCTRRLVASVRYGYGPPHNLVSSAENFDPQNKTTWPSWFMRPYVFKLPVYRYEQEIRFVLGVHPKITEQAGGVLIELNCKTLIQDVLFSDSIQQDEAGVIRSLLIKIWKGELPGAVYPAVERDLWQRRFNLIQGPPFTPQDDYPDLFPDLTDYR